MPALSGRRSPAWPVVAAALLVGAAWTTFVPPFEGPDESAFYQNVLAVARGRPTGGRSLYALVMKPALMLAGGQDRPFQARYNPSFRFISNQRGRVNVFMHGALDGFARGDVNRLYLLRLLTLLLWTVTVTLIFHTARLFFARNDLATLAAVLVMALPGFSFFATKVHPEATTVLLASAAYCLVAARIFGRIGRVPTWIGAFVLMALAPLSDRQAYFLVLFLPFTLVAMETTWRGRATAAGALVLPALVGVPWLLRRGIGDDLSTWLAPLTPSYRYGWWNADTLQYLAFEFAPKQVFGFVGWLGQPSILLPAPVYAALIVGVAFGLAGLALRNPASRLTPDQRRFAWTAAAGMALTVAPVLYTNIVIARTTTGRWLYPSITVIVIAVVLGWQRLAARIRLRPFPIAAALAIAAGASGLIWMAAPGDALRAGIRANHYGDADHLSRTIAMTLVFVAAAALAAAFVRVAPAPFTWPLRRPVVVVLAAGAVALNLLLLGAFIVPLYRPLDADALAAGVRAEIAEGEYGRASALYRLGAAAYPASSTLRRIENDEPLLVLAGGDDLMLASLRARVGRGEKLGTRTELLALARIVATRGWRERDMLEQVAHRAGDEPELREPLALIRAQAAATPGNATGADVVRAGGGRPVTVDMNGDAVLEGYTVSTGAGGRPEVTVYFSPRRDWTRRHLWLHAYPEGSHDYLVVDASPPAFQGWKPGDLAWETFPLPSNDRFTLYAGVEIAGNLGAAFPLGVVGGGHP